jgi:hypothetical protein
MALEPTALLDILASKLAKISAMLAAQQRPLDFQHKCDLK